MKYCRAGTLSTRMKTISVFCYLLYAAGIEGASIEVEAFEGEDVSFRCSHKYASTNHKYLCKDQCADGGDKLVTVQAGGRAASGRITLVDSGDGGFTVTFSHLQLSDTGQYWCAVERLGFNTFTEVQVTVKAAQLTTLKEAVAGDVTEGTPDLSATWTNPERFLSTEFTPETDTHRPANLSTGLVLNATVGTVALLTLLMLAITVRKCRIKLKPQPKVCSNSPVSAEEGEDDCEYDDIGEDVQSGKATPGLFSYSPANVHDQHDVISSIYIQPLPHISARTRKENGKHENKPTTTKKGTSKPTVRSRSNAAACHCGPCSESTEGNPKSLWFGLDVLDTLGV